MRSTEIGIKIRDYWVLAYGPVIGTMYMYYVCTARVTFVSSREIGILILFFIN